MPEGNQNSEPAKPTISQAAIQTLDVLERVVNVLEMMWESSSQHTYNIQVDPTNKS